MTTIKDIVMDIVSMYAVVGTDAIVSTRAEGKLWWGSEVIATVWGLFGVKSSIIHLDRRDGFDYFAVTWNEGDEMFTILVKVM